MPRLRSLSIFALMFAGGALAAPDYAASARVTLAPAAEQRCLKTAADGPVECGILEQVRVAFAARAAKMFTPGQGPGLTLVVTVTGAEVYELVTGPQLDLRVTTRVLAADESLIDEIESIARIATREAAVAGEAAANAAASDFADGFERSQKVRDSLIKSGAINAGDLAPPARSNKLLWLAAGAAVAQGGADGDVGFAPNFRIAVTDQWVMLQLSYTHFHTSFQGASQNQTFDSELDSNDLGLEAGAVFHLLPALELHLGPGVHALFAYATGADPFKGDRSTTVTKLAPTGFASLSLALLPFRNGGRLVIGLEARGYLATTVDLHDFGRSVPVVNSTFGVFFGTEIPWGSKGGSR